MSDAKVWLITSGSYSDYSVSCAFTTRELAIEYAAKRNRISAEEQELVERAQSTHFKAADELLRTANASPEARRAYNNDGYRVEELDLYDMVPVVEAELA